VNPASSIITVIGAGSWGTALAMLLARNGIATRLWGRDEKAMSEMQSTRCNKKYLPDQIFPENLQLTSDLTKALEGSTDILIAVPSHVFRNMLIDIKSITSSINIVWATKGLDPESNQLLHAVVQDIFGDVKQSAVLSGPSFAKEVAMGLPTAVTIASHSDAYAKHLIQLFHNEFFRVYQTDDLIGVQLCGAVKNVLAIAAGMSDGLGYGANARCALITRGLAEITRLGLALGAKQETFMGLAGMGDLVLTCTDDQSRNRRFGLALGQGADIESAEKAIGQVVEGKHNAKQVAALAEANNIDMPITIEVNKILQHQITPKQAVHELLARVPKVERGQISPSPK